MPGRIGPPSSWTAYDALTTFLALSLTEKSRPVLGPWLPADVGGDAELISSPPKLLHFVPVRCRMVRRLLAELSEDLATGPDGLPARILRNLADELALPVAILSHR